MNKRRFVSTKKSAIKEIIAVFLILVGIAATVLNNAYVNVGEIEKQMNQNLEDVAKQNAAILETKIYAQYKLLNSLAKELEGVTEETVQEKLNHFKIFIDDFELKRFAISFPGGNTYSTDGEVTNLSYRDFYQKGMDGKCYITGVLSDAIMEEHSAVNVMTVPVFDDDGNVSSVFGLAYDNDVFNKTLQINSFDGKSYSCIINEDGEIMSVIGDKGLELSQNIVDDLLKTDERNESCLSNLRNLMKQKKDGNGIIYLSGKHYYHIVPVEIMNGCVTWYIMTIIPSELLNERLVPIQKNQYLTVLFVICLIVAGGLMVIMYIRSQHNQMLRFAYEDSLTNGANYAKFHVEMQKKGTSKGCLIDMDIANFNNISIVAGEVATDVMIKETWDFISEALNKDELAAHVKDDMFLIFLTENDEDKILERMERISNKIHNKAKDFDVYGINARYGIYVLSEDGNLDSAYSKVKMAREYAVLKKIQNYAFYSEIDRVKIQHEKQLEDDFPRAIENKEFEVWYQPKYSAKECKVVGSEALVRWRKSDGTMVSPGEFIPLFETNGMIVKLDEYMFRMVCCQQKKWLDEGKTIYPVSINISRATLYCIDIHKRYKSIIQEYMIEPKYIQLEVTESVMEGKGDIYEILNRFRDIGIKILMDDFGTGYSSLATLSLQCFDTLKLDKTLIDNIGNKDGETMLYHIIHMGKQMGLHITAEGVEREMQLEFLQNMNCDDIQGFYFSKPLPKAEYEKMVN